jgi:CspA family cold shock protein
MQIHAFLDLSHPGIPPAKRSRSSKAIASAVALRGVLRPPGVSLVTKGTIKRLVGDKGFGFVTDHEGGEYFFHRSACQDLPFDELREGQVVKFEPRQGPKGPRAEHITTD